MIKNNNVVCIKWGNVYNAKDVNRLYNMIKRNTKENINFYCFTEDSEGIQDGIIVKPLPELNTIEEYKLKYAYQKEAGLCDDNLGGLKGQRVLFFDLDIVIIDNIDDFFKYPEDDKFYIINDPNTRGDKVGQATCYSWVVGTLGYVKEYYEKNPKEVVDKFYNASQEYLSSKVIEKYGKLNFWPNNWICSFRFDCMPKFGPLRHFITPSIPKNMPNLKIINFHGDPKPIDAINGYWYIRKGQKWKKLYKACKPTKWIEDYWY